MKPFIRRAAIAALASGSVALASPGCADSEAMLFVRQVQARVTPECLADNNPSSESLGGGTIDVAYRREYVATLLVGNQLVPRGNSSQLRVETARIAIQGAVVRLEDAKGALVWGPVTVPGAGFIEPATGSNASYGLTDTILIGTDYGNTLHDELSANPLLVRHFTAVARVFGRTLGGLNLDSGEWQFPIVACFGCLTSFPPEANDTRVMPNPPRNCFLAASTGTSVAPPCNVGQDDSVDCRVCKQFLGNDPLCEPAP